MTTLDEAIEKTHARILRIRTEHYKSLGCGDKLAKENAEIELRDRLRFWYFVTLYTHPLT